MMARVYIDTTIPSYLAANPSRDLVVAARQEMTHEWWKTAKERFSLSISEAVLKEIRRGDPEAARRREEFVQGLRILRENETVERLTEIYEKRLGLPEKGRPDVIHVAYAAAYRMDYLVTWNCNHLANGEVVRRLMELNQGIEVFTPLMLTPDELMGGEF